MATYYDILRIPFNEHTESLSQEAMDQMININYFSVLNRLRSLSTEPTKHDEAIVTLDEAKAVLSNLAQRLAYNTYLVKHNELVESESEELVTMELIYDKDMK